MTAYKFLCADRIGPFSRFAWPDGEWVEAEPSVCAAGVHACAAADLPYWLNAELWEIEVEDAVQHGRKLVAPRGRLLRRIEAWNREARQGFSDACIDSVQAIAAAHPVAAEYLSDLDRRAGMCDSSMCGFIAARAAEAALGPAGYEAERARQARWLADRLGLEAR